MKALHPLVLLLFLTVIAGVGHVKGDDVDAAVDAQMQQRHIPGLALAVIAGGKIIREQGYGFRDE